MKKRDKIIMILMFVLLVVFVSLIVVLGTKKLGEQKIKKEIPTPKPTVISENVTDEEKEVLARKLSNYDTYFITFDGKKDPLTMTEQEKIAFFVELLMTTDNGLPVKYGDSFSLELVSQTLKKYFGEKMEVKGTSYLCPLDGLPFYIYDEATKQFTLDMDSHGHGGTNFNVYNFPVSMKKIQKDKEILYTVEVKKVFSYLASDVYFPSTFYKTYEDAKESKNVIFDLSLLYGDNAAVDTDSLIKVQFEKQKGLFPVYKYEFKSTASVQDAYLVSLTR